MRRYKYKSPVHQKKTLVRYKRTWLVGGTLVIIALASLFFFNDLSSKELQSKNESSLPISVEAKSKKSGKLRIFSGKDFSKLYESFTYPNTELISEDFPITDNEETDKRIRTIAEARGYKMRSAPVTDTFVEVSKNMLLQERASKPWLDMQKSAKKEGRFLSLTAAYRSAEDQRTILLSKLKGISFKAIASGNADKQLDKILESTAVPSYSRHHTGYTIDLACENDPSVVFEKSSCFKWLSAKNYENAKQHGWIPSYPEGAGKQGPKPEAWEYVWVGIEALTE